MSPESQVELPAVGGLESAAILTTLAHHATPGSEELWLEPTTGGTDVATPGADVATGGTHRRLLDLGGAPTAVTVHLHPQGLTLQAPAAVMSQATAAVSWWFDLATDPAPIATRLASDPRLAPLVAQRPALRPVRHPAGFEAAIDTVLGQQVTLSSARLFGERLRTAYSPAVVAGLRVFPSPETLASANPEELRAAVGLTRARAATVQAVARLFADGFRLEPDSDPAQARAALLAVPGIGPWTAEYLALRVLGDPDAFPASDAVVRRALAGADARAALATATAWAPYRAWATAHLWAGQTIS